MSGHSKWSTIKRQKGAADLKRGQIFTKIANAITIAVRTGGSGDPESNPKLRIALESAKRVNMPKENISRAIDRGLGKLPGQTLEEVSFEGFGPGRVAYFIEGVTDNKTRTYQEVKNLFERSGGSLGSSGSTAYMFERKGEIKVVTKGQSIEDEILELIDLGAEDVEDYSEESEENPGLHIQKYLVYIDPSQLTEMSNKITQNGFIVEESGIVFKPTTLVEVSDKETAEKVLRFTENLEDRDDIQKVYANFDIDQKLMG